jgi:putative transposase
MRSVVEKRLVTQAFRFELDPNLEQRVLLAKSVGASRFVYNWGLAESQRTYELTGKRPRLGELKSRLVELKRAECPWLYEVSAHIGQQALIDLNAAYKRFSQGLKGEGPKSGLPRFKKMGERDSARLYEVELSEQHIRLPKIGRVRLKETRSERGFHGRILSATIRRRADRWFVSLAVEREREIVLPKPVSRATDVIGIDLGLTKAAVIHDGAGTRVIEPPKSLRTNLAKLRRLDRQLARKQRGSRNREKAKLRRARLHYKVSCQRQDFLHQLSSQLTRTKPVIVLEDLNVKGMLQNRSLALAIGDAGMGYLRRQLTYKSKWYGSTIVVADRCFPSTQLCSACGALNQHMKGYEGLRRRRFACPACGLTLDRDENAAINLRRFGLKALNVELGIVPLPEGLREVTPDGEEGSGSASQPSNETGLVEAGSVSTPRLRRRTQKHAERRAGAR